MCRLHSGHGTLALQVGPVYSPMALTISTQRTKTTNRLSLSRLQSLCLCRRWVTRGPSGVVLYWPLLEARTQSLAPDVLTETGTTAASGGT